MNVVDAILADAEGFPGRLALIGANGSVGLRDLADRTRIASAVLAAHGVGRGDVVALALPDRPVWVAAFLGLARLGAVAALVGEDVRGDRARDLITRSGARLAITERDDLGAIATVGVRDLRDDGGGADPGTCAMAPSDPLYLLAASGSTGPSTWAVHAHGEIPSCIARAGRGLLTMGPGDITWSVAALASGDGLGSSMYLPLGTGAAAWLGGSREPAAAAQACRDWGVNCLFGVPMFWARLAREVDDGRADARDFADVTLAVSAGEHLPDAVWHAVQRATGMRLVSGPGSPGATGPAAPDQPGAPGAGRVA